MGGCSEAGALFRLFEECEDPEDEADETEDFLVDIAVTDLQVVVFKMVFEV